MVTTRAGHAKMRVAELAASAREYQHPPSYDHDVDNIGLSFEELKHLLLSIIVTGVVCHGVIF